MATDSLANQKHTTIDRLAPSAATGRRRSFRPSSGSCFGKAFVDLDPRTSDTEPVFRARERPPTVLKFMVPGEPQSDFLGHELLISVERQAGGFRNSLAVQGCMKVYTAASERLGRLCRLSNE